MEGNYLKTKAHQYFSFSNAETLIHLTLEWDRKANFFSFPSFVFLNGQQNTERWRNWLNDNDRAQKRKKDDWGQHLRAGSKYRTTVHDGVNEKRREENGQQEDENDYQYVTNGNLVS